MKVFNDLDRFFRLSETKNEDYEEVEIALGYRNKNEDESKKLFIRVVGVKQLTKLIIGLQPQDEDLSIQKIDGEFVVRKDEQDITLEKEPEASFSFDGKKNIINLKGKFVDFPALNDIVDLLLKGKEINY